MSKVAITPNYLLFSWAVGIVLCTCISNAKTSLWWKNLIFWVKCVQHKCIHWNFSVLKKKKHWITQGYENVFVCCIFNTCSFWPVLWLHHLNDNPKTTDLNIFLLQWIAKLWGHWKINRKSQLWRHLLQNGLIVKFRKMNISFVLYWSRGI